MLHIKRKQTTMYYVIFQDNDGDLKILGDCSNSDQAEKLLQNIAIEFIKEEDGLKKAKNPFVNVTNTSMLSDNNIPFGHFLVQESDAMISVYRKAQVCHQGYFVDSITSSVERIGLYRTLVYTPREQITTNVCPECNTRTRLANDSHRYSMDKGGRYSALITDLKTSSFFLKMRELTDEYLRQEEEDEKDEEGIEFIDLEMQ